MTLQEWTQKHELSSRQRLAKKCKCSDAYMRMMVNDPEKFQPSRKLASLIEDGTLGDVTMLEAMFPLNPELWGKK